MIPDDFTGYFAAAATAAGALIGLLFVAGSLRPEPVLGRDAPPAAKAISGSAFTALFNSFFVALIALIPSTSLGYPAAVMALAAYLTQLGAGIAGGGAARTITAWSTTWCTCSWPRSRSGCGARGC